MRQQALGQRREESQMEIASRHALLQQKAQLELDQWVQHQQFNARDQEELTRQQNSLSELIAKVQSGEISEQEYYSQAGSVAPRVNALMMKDAHTKAQAFEEEKKAKAAVFQQQVKEMERADEYRAAQINGKFNFKPDVTKTAEVAQEIRDAFPELRGAEFDQKLNEVMAERGYGDWYFPDKDGKPVLDPASEAKKQSKMKEQQAKEEVKHRNLKAATDQADKKRKEMEAVGKPMSDEAWEAEVAKRFKILQGAEEGAAKLTPEQLQANLGAFDNKADALKNRLDIPQSFKEEGLRLLKRSRELLAKHGDPSNMKPLVKKEYDRLGEEFKKKFASLPGPAAGASAAPTEADDKAREQAYRDAALRFLNRWDSRR